MPWRTSRESVRPKPGETAPPPQLDLSERVFSEPPAGAPVEESVPAPASDAAAEVELRSESPADQPAPGDGPTEGASRE